MKVIAPSSGRSARYAMKRAFSQMVTLIKKVRLNVQKSVRSVVPKKSVKADGGKGTTLGISQDTVHLNCD